MSKHSRIHPVLLGLFILGSYTPAAFSSDHPISIVNAVAYVTRQSVLIRAEVLAEDLTLFHPIDPDDMDIYSVDQLKWAMNQHKDFLTKKLIVRDADGEKIPAKFHNLEPFEFPGIGVPAGDLMKYPAYYELEYFFDEPPEFLTFEQNIIDDLTLLPSEVKLGVKQSGNETGQGFVLTPGSPETARFDWNQPPLSDEASDEEWLKLRTQQENDVLGITSYSSPYSFIYITPHEVRHEVLVPLAILARTFPIERQNISFLEVQEQDNARPHIEAFLKDNNPVKIDGVIVQPIFDRIDFYGLRLKDFAMQSERKRISMANGRVGVIMRYPAKTPPRTVSVVWDLFPPQIRKVEAVIVAPDKVEKFQFTKIKKLKSDEDNNLNEFVWHNSKDAEDFTIAKIPFDYQRKRYSFSVMTVTAGLLLIFSAVVLYLSRSSAKLQLGSLVIWILVGSLGWNFTIIKVDDPFEPQFSVSGEEADRIVSSLVTNVYRAFDYNDESEIYDAIAQSADGKLLKEIYLSVQKTRQMQQQGGALTEINRVEFLDGQKKKDADSNGFDYQCTWVVNGTVEHWGHIHERTNQFTADLTIEPVDKAWRIVRREIVDAQQSSKTELRRLDPKG
ncbi:hypothetical protein OAG56_04320 [Mariniblastus sp.]|jgi:hypothetical protein|nr:hypothetical protein [Mariniblastus sp.]MDB4756576.1 hypothetical protein [Mariniblastus sp.]